MRSALAACLAALLAGRLALFPVLHELEQTRPQDVDAASESDAGNPFAADKFSGRFLRRLVEQDRKRPETQASRRVEAAWRDLEAAGISRSGADEETRRLKREMERAAREAKADQQLDELKKKMGKG